MKLWIVSDTHLDHGGPWLEPPPEADIAVIAGDACDGAWLETIAAKLPTVFVCGNHELYGHAFSERMDKLRGRAWWLLDNGEVTILGIRFVGATLWTDYAGGNAIAMQVARDSMNDHRLIKWQKEPWMRFRPNEALALHRESVAYLRSVLADNCPAGVPTVVVTHHAPSMLSVHPRFAGNILNHAFASDLDYLVEGSDAALWVHGHVHDPFSYSIGKTRVICNPRGYPHEAGNGFNPNLLVEV
ncbi:MAG: metallophosphoesterase [Minisyncoccota bacterium]